MKAFILLVTLVVIYATAHGQPRSLAAEFKKLYWLAGKWNRIDGGGSHERWDRFSDSEWRGTGITMRGPDTVFVERLKLVLKDDNIFYVADVPGNQDVVYFKLTGITGDEFTCENPEHDFPQKIRYRRHGNRMKATISGGGKSIDYWFERSD